jgi:hypothetical protein
MPHSGKGAPRRNPKKAGVPNNRAARIGASWGIDPDDLVMANLREMVQDHEDYEMSLSGTCPRCGGAGGQMILGTWHICAWCRGENNTPAFR